MGKPIGRPPLDIKIQQAIKQMVEDGMTGCQIAKELRIGVSTAYRYISAEKAKDVSKDVKAAPVVESATTGIRKSYIFVGEEQDQVQTIKQGERPKAFDIG